MQGLTAGFCFQSDGYGMAVDGNLQFMIEYGQIFDITDPDSKILALRPRHQGGISVP